MKNFVFYFFIALLLACNTQTALVKLPYDYDAEHGDCGAVFDNEFSKIEYDVFEIEEEYKMSRVTQLKYVCIGSSDLASKIMYDLYGPWSFNVKRKNDFRAIKIWEEVDLLGLGEMFTVFTYPYMDNNTIYTSFMVFDSRNVDALKETSKHRKAIEDYFTQAIKQNDTKVNDYYMITRRLAFSGKLYNPVFDDSVRSERGSLDSMTLGNVFSFLAQSDNQPTNEMPYVVTKYYPGKTLWNSTGLATRNSIGAKVKSLRKNLNKLQARLIGVCSNRKGLER